MAEYNNGETSPTAVYEQDPTAYNVRRAGERLQAIFGDDLDPKSWSLENNDPLRMRRYRWDENDVFVISLRSSEMLGKNTLTSVENGFRDKQRMETVFVLQVNEHGSRMACFSDNLIKETQADEAIFALFDKQDELTAEDFNTQLATLAEERQQVTWRKDHNMISDLQARPELNATANQVRDLNQLLHYVGE